MARNAWFLVSDLNGLTNGKLNREVNPNERARRYYIKAEKSLDAVLKASKIPFYMASEDAELEAIALG